MKSCYLDWCPRATSGLLKNVYIDEIDLSSIFANELGEFPFENKISYSIRTDGIFIFQISWNYENFDVPDKYSNRLLWAHIISGLIKEKEGHNHFFDSDRISERLRKYKEGISPISVDPIELLAEESFENYSVSLDDDFKVCCIKGANLGEVLTQPASALLLLRSQYVKCFDRFYAMRNHIQKTRFPFKYFRKFEIYSARNYIYIMFILIPLLMAQNIISRLSFSSGEISVNAQFVHENLFETFWDTLAGLSIPFCILIYIVVVSLKRRKILKLVFKTKGFLRFGNIYNKSIRSIFEKCDNQYKHSSDFDDCIAIIEEIELIERRKRTQAQLTISSVFILSFSRFKGVLEGFYPNIDEILPFLGAIPIFVR